MTTIACRTVSYRIEMVTASHLKKNTVSLQPYWLDQKFVKTLKVNDMKVEFTFDIGADVSTLTEAKCWDTHVVNDSASQVQQISP